jgi:hypothetical protein
MDAIEFNKTLSEAHSINKAGAPEKNAYWMPKYGLRKAYYC